MNNKLRTLDLFSGIGGFSLGLESTGGFRTVAFCEIEPYPRNVLAKHWPGVPCYNDVREITADRLAADGIAVDVVCGGFPCQDISVAGRGAGLSGDRSGLWFEMLRVIEEAQPKFAIIENVPALRSRGLDAVLRGLALIGYDAEWHCIPAVAVGAPHRRDRVWVIAYPARELSHRGGAVAWQDGRAEPPDARGNVANPSWVQSGWKEQWTERKRIGSGCKSGGTGDVCDANGAGLAIGQGERSHARQKLTSVERTDWWGAEPDVGRVANGVPSRVDRLRALGNAVVPQVVEAIGRAILASMGNEATGDSVNDGPYRPDVEQSPA